MKELALSVKISTKKKNYLNFEALHEVSSKVISTDAPKDNGGTGSSFSPTDLLATAYLTCAMTIIDLKAKAKGLHDIQINGSIKKSMIADPQRRIGKLEVNIDLSESIATKDRAYLEAEARACPVALSISDAIDIDLQFSYQL